LLLRESRSIGRISVGAAIAEEESHGRWSPTDGSGAAVVVITLAKKILT
jgi:hypothetical protein